MYGASRIKGDARRTVLKGGVSSLQRMGGAREGS